MTGEKARNVLEEDEPGSVSLGQSEECVGEAAAGSLDHASSLPGNAEVLAWKTAGPEGSPMPLPIRSVGSGLTVIRVPPVESKLSTSGSVPSPLGDP